MNKNAGHGIIIVLFAALLFVAATVARADNNWSCGSRIVSTGDTKSEVMLKCGEPTWKDTHVSEHYEKYRGNVIGGSVQTEVWLYNLGPSQLTRMLYFENSKLVRIETGEHGYHIDGSRPRICRPEEIHVGDDKFDVWAKCGEPLLKDERVEKRVRGLSNDRNVYYVNVDEWTYNFGTQRFMRLLRFENSELVAIREIDRGR